MPEPVGEDCLRWPIDFGGAIIFTAQSCEIGTVCLDGTCAMASPPGGSCSDGQECI